MRKYEELVTDILKNIGGKENIISLTHCITRLRFRLQDESKANDDVLKNMDGVVSVIKSSGQYQVVIGNHVADVYDEVCLQAGISDTEVKKDTEEEKQPISKKIMDLVTGIMMPIVPVMAASGMIKGILAILVFAGCMSSSSGIYTLLSAVGDTVFYFIPVMMGYTSAKKLNMDPFIGLVIGAALVYPTIQNAGLDILGFNINVSYTSTVLPIILTNLLASVLYKKLVKVIPSVIKTFFVPMLTMLIAIPLGYIVIGPIANIIADGIAAVIMGVYNFNTVIAGILLAGLWQVLVVFGVHMGLSAVAMVQLGSGQPTPIYALTCISPSFSQTATVFAIWLKTKDKKLKDIALPAWVSGIFGVTEPAIYGITLPRIKYFVISCIGAALGGAYCGFSGMLYYQLAGLGIFSFTAFMGGAMSVGKVIFNFIIVILISAGFSFVATYVLYKDEESKQDSIVYTDKKETDHDICAPAKGKVLPLSSAKDQAFAEGSMGKGVVIEPEEGKIYAPADGVVSALFPTLHAIGIRTNGGADILIHVGINTVELGGEGFQAHIKQGDVVKQGDLMVEADLEFIKNKNLSTQTMVIITNSEDMDQITMTQKTDINPGEVIMSAF